MRLSFGRGPGSLFTALAAGVLLGASGCGGGTGTVKGRVLYQGSVVKGGNVIFKPSADEKRLISTPINEDGTYSAEKVPVGPAKIAIENEFMNPEKLTGVPSYKPPPGKQGPKLPDREAMVKRYVRLPEVVSDPDKSGLTYTVESGTQDHDINIP